MRVVLQRVSSASVLIAGTVHGAIEHGFLILLGIEQDDAQADIDWLCRKISNMRIFSDEADKMNLSIQDKKGAFLVISQFTLHASTKKGNRPSFIRAARLDVAIPLYENFLKTLRETSGLDVQSGEFGADMKVHLVNDGPVTIVMDSKDKQ